MAAVFLDVVLVTGLEVELVVDVFAPDHLHTQPQSPFYIRTHPFHPPPHFLRSGDGDMQGSAIFPFTAGPILSIPPLKIWRW